MCRVSVNRYTQREGLGSLGGNIALLVQERCQISGARGGGLRDLYLSKANNETRLEPKLRPALWEVGIQMPTLSARGKASIACNAGEVRVGNSLQKLISRVVPAFLWKN